MVTCKMLECAASAFRYFAKDWEFLGVARYFSDDRAADRRERTRRRRESRWFGAGAEALGLRGPIKPKRFEQLLEGYIPGTSIRLGRRRRDAPPRAAPAPGRCRSAEPATPESDPATLWQHRPGLDLTFSPPKSVSLEALVYASGRMRARILRADREAVEATLAFADRELLQTRGHVPGTGRRPRVPAHGLVAALFPHMTSRDLDPQRHTHAVILNMIRDGAGSWRSMDFTLLRRSLLLLGAVYRTELQQRLEALGYATVPTLVGRMPGFEIAGYPPALLQHFSQRRQAVLEWIRTQGLTYSPRTAQIATLATRRRKREPTRPELETLWADRARDFGPPRDWEQARGRKGPPRGPAPPALEVARRAVDHCEERATVFSASLVRGWALAHAGGRHALAAIDAALGTLERERVLVPVRQAGVDAAYTTRRALAAEKDLLRRMRAGIDAGSALAGPPEVEGHLARGRFTVGQGAAVRLVLTSRHRVVGVQGHAGSGKTTMLRLVADLAAGHPRLALAPSAAATRILAAETGLPARTVQWFLVRYRAIGDDSADPRELAAAREKLGDGLLIVDEASMIGTAAMRQLLRIAERARMARVALVGDRRQLSAVAAGQPFRLLQDAGLPCAHMDEVLRQRSGDLRAVVAALVAREPARAIAGLGANVIEIGEDSGETTAGAAARLWLELAPGSRTGTAIVAPTHAERAEISAAIRAGLAAEGVLRGRMLEIDRYVNLHLTPAEKAEAVSYRTGDIAVFHTGLVNYRVRSGDACAVRGVLDDRVELAHPDGSPRHIRPAGQARYRLDLYEPRPIALRTGDRIRWTRNYRRGGLELDNGAAATITGIDRRRVGFRADDGREYSLVRGNPHLHHLDHAYATTVYGAQGMTCDRVIAVLDAGRGALPDQAAFYVEITRARDSAVLLTDDREALAEALEARTGEERSALEAVGAAIAPEAPAPSRKPAVSVALAAWQDFANVARERGQHPFAAAGREAVLAPVLARAAAAGPDTPPAVLRLAGEHRTWTVAVARADAHHAALATVRDRLAAGLEERHGNLPQEHPDGAWAIRPDRAAWRQRMDQALGAIPAGDPGDPPIGADRVRAVEHDVAGLRLAYRHAQLLDGLVCACSRTLAHLDREADAGGGHRFCSARYPTLVAAAAALTGDAGAASALPSALAGLPDEAAALERSARALDTFLQTSAPALAARRASGEREPSALRRGFMATPAGETWSAGADPLVEEADRLLDHPDSARLLAAAPPLRRAIADTRSAVAEVQAFDRTCRRVLARLRDIGDSHYAGPEARAIFDATCTLIAWHDRAPRVVRPPRPPWLMRSAGQDRSPPGAAPSAPNPVDEPQPGPLTFRPALPAPLTSFQDGYRSHLARGSGPRYARRERLLGCRDTLQDSLDRHAAMAAAERPSPRLICDDPRYGSWARDAMAAWREATDTVAREPEDPPPPPWADGLVDPVLMPPPIPPTEMVRVPGEHPDDSLSFVAIVAQIEHRRARLHTRIGEDFKVLRTDCAEELGILRRDGRTSGPSWTLRRGLATMTGRLRRLEHLAEFPDLGPLPTDLRSTLETHREQHATLAQVQTFAYVALPGWTRDRIRLLEEAERRDADSVVGLGGYAASAEAGHAIVAEGKALSNSSRARDLLQARPGLANWITDATRTVDHVLRADQDTHRIVRQWQQRVPDPPGRTAGDAPAADGYWSLVNATADRLTATPDRSPGAPPKPSPDDSQPVAPDAGAMEAVARWGERPFLWNRFLASRLHEAVPEAARAVAECRDDLRGLTDQRRAVREDAVANGSAVQSHRDYPTWQARAGATLDVAARMDAVMRRLPQAGGARDDAEPPILRDLGAARQPVARALANDLALKRLREELLGQAARALAGGHPPFHGEDFEAAARRIAVRREYAAPGEVPPSLTEIAADPGAQRGLHVRIRHCGMGTLPAMESLVDRRDQFRREAAARADAPAVTEQPAYRDWATAARTILAELPRDLLHDRFALHWELVDREVPGGRTRPRIESATGSLAEVLDIDRQVAALQADPLAPAGPAERPWTKREHVKDGPAYDTFFKRVEALRKQAPREGDVPRFLVEAAGAFRQWSADRTAIAEPLGVLSAAVQRQRELLTRAGTGDQPFQETAPDLHRQWREEADRIKQARRAFARAWRGYRKRHHAPIRPLPGDPTAYRSGVRILETLPSLAALPARTLLEWHDAMTAKSADDGDWYRSDTCGTMRHAWRRLDRSAAADDPGREDDARRLRDLDEAAGLFRHEHFISLVRELREQDGSDTWLADPGTPDWSSTVLYQEQEACAFLGDTATRERLSKRFPRVTEKLSNDLQFVSNALDPLREEFRLRAARQAEQDAIDDEIVKRERKREAREREAWERSLDQEPVRKPESPSRTQAPAPIRTPGNDWGYGR